MNKPNQLVSIIYKGTLADGTVVDECNEPYQIRLCARQIMLPLDRALLEMEVGEERTIAIEAKDAFGEYNPEAVQTAPVYDIPNWEKLPVGERIMWTYSPGAKPVAALVVAVEAGSVTLDFNHPLAGKDLVYWIKLVSVA